MKKNTVKKIFIFFMIFLPLQYAAVGIVGVMASEPWPAFVLPAFQNVDSTPKYVSVLKPELIAIDSKGKHYSNIDPSLIFYDIEESQLQGFLLTHLGDSLKWSKKREESKKWFIGRANDSYPDIELKELHMQWLRVYYNYSSSVPLVDSTSIIEEFFIFADDE